MSKLLLAAAVAVALQQATSAQGFFGGPNVEVKVVERFDADKNGRLDTAERQEARKSLGATGVSGGFQRRRGGLSPAGPSTRPPGLRVTPADVKPLDQATLYDPSALRTIFLRFENSEWNDELAAFYNTDVEVPATAIVDGQTYNDIGVHYRGFSSYRMVGDEAKKSLNLSFDFVNDKQRLLGYRTLNLLNGNGDPSFVRTMLYSEIARRYIPAPKTNYVRVVINDENYGVYINAEQFNTDFTRDFYSSTRGARWKVPGSPRGNGGMQYLGDEVAAYKRLYDIRSRDDRKSWDALISMFRILNQTPIAELEAALAPVLDIDGVLKFLAVEVALVNSDGYWARASDYGIYQDEKGRFHVIPHDFNETMSQDSGFGFGGGGGGTSLDPLVGLDDASKPLRSRLLKVPALRERYLGYVNEIAQTWLDWKKLEPLVRQYRSVIAAEMTADTRRLYSQAAFDEGPAEVKAFVEARRAYLLRAGRPDTVK